MGEIPPPQTLRQCQVANQLQLSHLRLDAGQADTTVVGLQHAEAEHRAAAVRHIVQIPRVPVHQCIKPSPSLRSQGPRDLSEKPLFKGMDCCPDQTLGVLFGWRLQALLSAPVSDRDPQVCRLQVTRGHLGFQPAAQPSFVGHLDGAEAEIAPNPLAVTLGAAPAKVVLEPRCGRSRHLLAQER